MKVIIAGPRDFFDYEVVKQAISKSKFEITEVVSGMANGVDRLGERWAEENGVDIESFPADWNNTKAKGARIKINKWGKKYNANAGFARNEKMAKYADALIAIDNATPGTNNMINTAKAHELDIYVHSLISNEIDDDHKIAF